jgi:Flp pilus assembly protein TadG
MGDSKLPFHRRRREHGQTIILVAVAMVGLLGMVALAIDVVTLYVARSEMQRAADAAALAGAPCGGAGCGTNQFRPALVDPASPKLCPACQGVFDYENGIECCDTTVYACGSTATPVTVDTTMTPPGLMGARTNNGLQCMTNNPAQDTIDTTDLTAGTGPAHIIAGSGPQSGNLVTTSRSVATLPIIDSPTTPTVHVIGFASLCCRVRASECYGPYFEYSWLW